MIKKYVCILSLLLIVSTSHSFSQKVEFEKYFESKTLRLDYYQSGNSHSSSFHFDKFKKEPFWGGSKTNLIDTFRYGEFMLEVYHLPSKKLIYSRGYATLFREWQTTAEAALLSRSFPESAVMPFPKDSVLIKIWSRNADMSWTEVFAITLSPDNYFIQQESIPDFPTGKMVDSGDPSVKLDLVILPEGYTKKEMKKFRDDAHRFASLMFDWAPFDSLGHNINVWLVEAPSEESGTDIPGDTIWRKTLLNSHFYTFDSERYLTTTDFHQVRNVAACVPYDQIYILVNSSKYGGGGIYNFYSVCTSDHELSDFVFMHEFGHGFASLGDEYYTSSVAYEDYYNLEVEPYQPNLTTLQDFDSKWKDMIDDDTPVPTPPVEPYINKIGVFEGGGYVAKGVYRPTYDSSMKSRLIDDFGPVNERAIIHMIHFYAE